MNKILSSIFTVALIAGCATKSLYVDKYTIFSEIRAVQIKEMDIDKYNVGNKLKSLFSELSISTSSNSPYVVVYEYKYAS